MCLNWYLFKWVDRVIKSILLLPNHKYQNFIFVPPLTKGKPYLCSKIKSNTLNTCFGEKKKERKMDLYLFATNLFGKVQLSQNQPVDVDHLHLFSTQHKSSDKSQYEMCGKMKCQIRKKYLDSVLP